MANNIEIYMFTAALMCYIWAFGSLCILSGFENEKKYKRARYANILGFFVAASALCLRWYNSGHAPLSNMYESLVVLSTFIMLAGLLFTQKEKMPFLEASADVLAITMIGISSLFPSTIKPLVPALQSYWLPLHVSLAFLGESCFAIAVILSYFYCLKRLNNKNLDAENKLSGLEEKLCFFIAKLLPTGLIVLIGAISAYMYSNPATRTKGIKLGVVTVLIIILMIIYKSILENKALKLLPDEEKLDQLTYKAIKVGYPLFTVGGLIFGMIWANKAWGRYWGWDPKETWALVTFLVYSLYLHIRIVMGKDGVIPACLSVLGFLATMFTLFGVNFLISGLHSYA